jgi:RNA polymerase sigma factor (TIGR02999 family)
MQDGGKSAHDVTHLLRDWRDGDVEGDAATRLLRALYGELHRVALQRISRESDTDISPTELVNETWLRLVPEQVPVEDRHAFLRFASVAMRNILVDQARERASSKRGGNWQRITISLAEAGAGDKPDATRLLDLDRALTGLGVDHPRVAEAIGLRVFTGLDLADVAETLGISLATVKRDLAFGRAWLGDALHG